MKFKPLFAASMLCASTSAFAQGIIQFDWHGDDNVFQASFQTTVAAWPYGFDVYPYNPILPQQTLAITSPDRVWLAGSLENWGTSPEKSSIFFSDDQSPARVIVFIGSVGQVGIGEAIYNGPSLFHEYGHWESHVVPEPSAFALLGLGLLGLYMKKATSLNP